MDPTRYLPACTINSEYPHSPYTCSAIFAVDSCGADEAQSEVRHPLKQTLKRGLVDDGTDQHRPPLLAGECHAIKCLLDIVTELSFDDKSILAMIHLRIISAPSRYRVPSRGNSYG